MFYGILYSVITCFMIIFMSCFIKFPDFNSTGIMSPRIWGHSVFSPSEVPWLKNFCPMVYNFAQVSDTRILIVYSIDINLKPHSSREVFSEPKQIAFVFAFICFLTSYISPYPRLPLLLFFQDIIDSKYYFRTLVAFLVTRPIIF